MKRFANALLLSLLIAASPRRDGAQTAPDAAPTGGPDLRFALKNGSVRWAVIGDNGTGRVGDRAADGAGIKLGQHGHGKQQDYGQTENHKAQR
mgnify:CR=1 FL=1